MGDVIFIKDLCIECIIGILPHEREHPQRLSIDVELTIPKNDAATTEDIASCPVNYATVREHIIEFARTNKLQLVETFAENLIQELLNNFNCLNITLSIAKLDAFEDVAACGIRIHRIKNAI